MVKYQCRKNVRKCIFAMPVSGEGPALITRTFSLSNLATGINDLADLSRSFLSTSTDTSQIMSSPSLGTLSESSDDEEMCDGRATNIPPLTYECVMQGPERPVKDWLFPYLHMDKYRARRLRAAAKSAVLVHVVPAGQRILRIAMPRVLARHQLDSPQEKAIVISNTEEDWAMLLCRLQQGSIPGAKERGVSVVLHYVVLNRDPEVERASAPHAALRKVWGTRSDPGVLKEAWMFLTDLRWMFVRGGGPVCITSVLGAGVPMEDVNVALSAQQLTMVMKGLFETEKHVSVGPALIDRSAAMNHILDSKRVAAALDKEVAAGKYKSMGEGRIAARRMLSKMAARYDPSVIRLFDAALTQLFGRLFDGVDVDMQGLERLRDVARRTKAPVVYVPAHRSHIDYLVLSFVSFRFDLAMPHIAAGDNLDIPIIGPLFRQAGAFFIRRKFGSDTPLYTALVNEYITLLLERGQSIEFFFEGGRSRTGKLRPPKMGLLGTIADAVHDGRVPEVLVVPVSIVYDQVVEEASLMNELLGKEKQKESLGAVFRARALLNKKYGRVHVQFAEPISLQEHHRSNLALASRSSAPLDSVGSAPRPEEVSAGARKVLTKSLATTIVDSLNNVSVASAVHLTATALLCRQYRASPFYNGVMPAPCGESSCPSGGADCVHTFECFVSRVEWLGKFLVRQGLKLTQEVTRETIEEALVMLFQDNALEVIRQNTQLSPVKCLELSFYRNHILHHTLNAAILSCAFKAAPRQPGAEGPSMDVLVDEAVFLASILRNDFPELAADSEEMKTRLTNVLHRLSATKEIFRSVTQPAPSTVEGSGALDVVVTVSQSEQREVEFLRTMLWPYVECCHLVFDYVHHMPKNGPRDEKGLLRSIQVAGRKMFNEGTVFYPDAMSAELITSTLRTAQMLGCLRVEMVNKKRCLVRSEDEICTDNVRNRLRKFHIAPRIVRRCTMQSLMVPIGYKPSLMDSYIR